MAHLAEVEQRCTAAKVEVRSAAGGARRIGGYASRFNQVSEPLPFREVVDRRFFDRSEAAGFDGVVARFEHSNLHVLGSVASSTLRLNVDDVGLNYVVDLPDTAAGNDTYELVSRGDVAFSSMAFIVDAVDGDSWDYRDGSPLRTLLSAAKIVDVSPVSQPAYRSTDCALRSLAEAKGLPLADVQRYAESDRLAEFFVRSDRSSQRMSGKQAQLALMKRRWTTVPGSPKLMTPRQKVVEVLGRRWTMPTGPSKPMTAAQRRVELLGKRWGPGEH